WVGGVQGRVGLWMCASAEVGAAAGLRDKRVGITRRGSTAEVGLGYYLDKFGLVADRDLAVVEIGDQAAMVPALKSGAIQAAVLSDPATFTAKREGFRELADLTQLGVEYPQSALTTTGGLAAGRRDLVERFMRSVYEGTHRYKTDRALGLEVLGKYFQTSDPELLASAYDLYVGRLVQDAPRANLDGTRTVLAELAATNEQARGADPARFLDLSFVEALTRQGLERAPFGPQGPGGNPGNSCG